MDKKRIAELGVDILEWLGVAVFGLLVIGAIAIGVTLAWIGPPPEEMGHTGVAAAAAPEEPVPLEATATRPAIPEASAEEADSLFAPVYSVLTHPRCMNCHPDGDRPLSDKVGTHAMNISRASFESGLECTTCHAEHNTELPGAPPGPPGAPHWQLPPKETPMIFQNRTVTELCVQLRSKADNGERSLADLLHHVEHDPLVLWGWEPGGQRAKPPISHAEFTAAMKTWVDAGGICPGETEPPALEDAGETGGEAGGGAVDAHAAG
ncbi:hypothetical protein PPSIR1_17685 [Plesiocystis pacifica SIR-1]|uniref:Isoquinoline 1-oxidoreductase subunit n=1 Tax=Plesiocystis pacifica SIR-1 TaxID=391625 RepID=A6GEC1_9BACT|nr:hypothetical protein [Plesiocystis pacifica]EDM75762.1 hypothetical protein PPSIR1_17685 [Plesiocystis pacifica SIR-1]